MDVKILGQKIGHCVAVRSHPDIIGQGFQMIALEPWVCDLLKVTHSIKWTVRIDLGTSDISVMETETSGLATHQSVAPLLLECIARTAKETAAAPSPV